MIQSLYFKTNPTPAPEGDTKKKHQHSMQSLLGCYVKNCEEDCVRNNLLITPKNNWSLQPGYEYKTSTEIPEFYYLLCVTDSRFCQIETQACEKSKCYWKPHRPPTSILHATPAGSPPPPPRCPHLFSITWKIPESSSCSTKPGGVEG